MGVGGRGSGSGLRRDNFEGQSVRKQRRVENRVDKLHILGEVFSGRGGRRGEGEGER